MSDIHLLTGGGKSLNRRRMMASFASGEVTPASDGKIWAYYDVSTTESATKLLGGTTGIGAMMNVDGTDTSRVASYTFSTTGIHLVKFTPTNTNIQAGVFKNIPRLTELYIPSYIIGDSGSTANNNYAISDNALLTKVALPNTYKSAGHGLFGNCPSLSDVNLDSIVSCLSGFCKNTPLLKIPLKMPNLTTISGNAFMSQSGITSIENIGSISSFPACSNEGSSNFRLCNLTKIQLPNTLLSIGQFSFLQIKGVTSIVIPDSVNSIGASTFGSGSFNNIDLGAGIISIADNAWYGCNILTVTCRAVTPPTLGTRVFATTYQTVARNMQAVYVPAESVDAYREAAGWSAYASKIQAI